MTTLLAHLTYLEALHHHSPQQRRDMDMLRAMIEMAERLAETETLNEALAESLVVALERLAKLEKWREQMMEQPA